MKDTTAVDVFLASPADAQREREFIDRTISEWNGVNTRRFGVSYVVRRWETGLRSGVGFGLDAQGMINETLLDESDLLIAVFGKSLGRQRTSSAKSSWKRRYATVKELIRFMKASKNAWVYFLDAATRQSDIELDQLRNVRSFQDWLRKKGVVFTVDSHEQLHDKLKEDLTEYASELNLLLDRESRVSTEKIEKVRWSTLSPKEQHDLYERFNKLGPTHHLPLAPVADDATQLMLQQRAPLDLSLFRRLADCAGFDSSLIKFPCSDEDLKTIQGWRLSLIDYVTDVVSQRSNTTRQHLFREIYDFLKTPDPNYLASDMDISSCDAILVPGARKGHPFRIDATLEIVQRSGARVILSGSHPVYDPNQTLPIGEAEAMDYYLRHRLSAQSIDVRLETRAKTTLESLFHSLVDMTELRQELGRPINLIAVTSPYHMHRLLRQLDYFYSTRRHIVANFKGKLCTASFDFNVFRPGSISTEDRKYGIGIYIQELMKLFGGRVVGEF